MSMQEIVEGEWFTRKFPDFSSDVIQKFQHLETSFAKGQVHLFLQYSKSIWLDHPETHSYLVCKLLPTLAFKYIGLTRITIYQDIYELAHHPICEIDKMFPLYADIVIRMIRARFSLKSCTTNRNLYHILPIGWSVAWNSLVVPRDRNAIPFSAHPLNQIFEIDVLNLGVLSAYEAAVAMESLRPLLSSSVYFNHMFTPINFLTLLFEKKVDPSARFIRASKLFILVLRQFMIEDIGDRALTAFYWLCFKNNVFHLRNRTTATSSPHFFDVLTSVDLYDPEHEALKQRFLQYPIQLKKEKEMIKNDSEYQYKEVEIQHLCLPEPSERWTQTFASKAFQEYFLDKYKYNSQSKTSKSSTIVNRKIIPPFLRQYLKDLDELAIKEFEKQTRQVIITADPLYIQNLNRIAWSKKLKGYCDSKHIWVGPFEIAKNTAVLARTLFRARKMRQWNVPVPDVVLTHATDKIGWLRYDNPILPDHFKNATASTVTKEINPHSVTLDYPNYPNLNANTNHLVIPNPNHNNLRIETEQLLVLQVARFLLGIKEASWTSETKETYAVGNYKTEHRTVFPTTMMGLRGPASYIPSTQDITQVTSRHKRRENVFNRAKVAKVRSTRFFFRQAQRSVVLIEPKWMKSLGVHSLAHALEKMRAKKLEFNCFNEKEIPNFTKMFEFARSLFPKFFS